jgi:hypothetical protein
LRYLVPGVVAFNADVASQPTELLCVAGDASRGIKFILLSREMEHGGVCRPI